MIGIMDRRVIRRYRTGIIKNVLTFHTSILLSFSYFRQIQDLTFQIQRLQIQQNHFQRTRDNIPLPHPSRGKQIGHLVKITNTLHNIQGTRNIRRYT